MKIDALRYDLPPDLIAQRPAVPRDSSRLLVVHRETATLEHRSFRDLPEYLRPGDCLVLNDTRVIPARFFLKRRTGAQIEALFLRASETHPGAWHVLLRNAGRVAIGERLIAIAAPHQGFETIARLDRGEWVIRPDPPADPIALLDQIGQTPLPPYIGRPDATGPTAEDRSSYQTVYAANAGSAAAPTAGLHFTDELLQRVAHMGVARAKVTLHVGLGTFQPITTEDVRDHAMHAEWFSASAASAEILNRARSAGGRIIAVGTTSLRVLESLSSEDRIVASESWTRIFITPGFAFRHTDALITNFHLPESTLLALVMAFTGVELTREAYATAIRERYRFYSYGDAMLIID